MEQQNTQSFQNAEGLAQNTTEKVKIPKRVDTSYNKFIENELLNKELDNSRLNETATSNM